MSVRFADVEAVGDLGEAMAGVRGEGVRRRRLVDQRDAGD